MQRTETLTSGKANYFVETYLPREQLYNARIEEHFLKDLKPIYHIYSGVHYQGKETKRLSVVSLEKYKQLLLKALLSRDIPVEKVTLLQGKHGEIYYVLYEKVTYERKKENDQKKRKGYFAQRLPKQMAPVYYVNNNKKTLRKSYNG